MNTKNTYSSQVLSPSEKWRRAGISDDFIFGKLMTAYPGIYLELLRRILPELDIESISYSERQKSVDNSFDSKGIRLDVFVRDESKRTYTVEMQMTDSGSLARRSRYYQSMTDLMLLERGGLYEELPESYVIFICPFDPFGCGRSIYCFRNICLQDKETTLDDGTEKIFLNAQGREGEEGAGLKGFLDLVAGREPEPAFEDSFTADIRRALDEVKKNREWRREYMTLEMKFREIEREATEKGIEQGKSYGLKEGMVSAFKEMGLSDKDILEKLMSKFNINKKEAEKYLK